jgi:AcrR family transcriptional regulator
MPRQPDPELESRILNAAHKLWKRGGDPALTLRSVAREAGTNTPAVYRRFQDRDAIIRALMQRMRQDLAALLEEASSPEEGCERYLEYALSHPHEYELFFHYNYQLDYSPQARRAGIRVRRPARDAIQAKLVKDLGGSAADHEDIMTALWMMAHGAAMLLLSKSIEPKDAQLARAAFTRSVRALLKDAARLHRR